MGYVHRFLAERGPLFASRVRAGRIRDCHGDLRLQHVYALGPRDHPGGQLAIIDCIEFNERFRYGDVAGEVAFLAMELDAAGRPELARTFVDEYVAETGDEALRELLPFYACYRACVRGKVASFQLDEPEVPPAQREAAQRQAASLFELADRYASGPTRPQLVLVGGLMGTGKTALAHALRRELGWALYASDTTRKRLAHLDPTVPQPAGVGEGIYSPEWTARTYQALLAEAGLTLAEGRSVLLDATFGNRRDRQAAAQIAAAYGARAVFIECACPRAVALARLARRWSMRTEESAIRAGKHPKDAGASDGRPELYDAQCAAWEPFDGAVEPGLEHTVRSTDLPLAIEVGSGREALRGLSDTGTLAPLMRHEPAQQADAIS